MIEKILEITPNDIRKEVKRTINEAMNHYNSPFILNVPKTHKFIVEYPKDYIVTQRKKAEITRGHISFIGEKISSNIIHLITKKSTQLKKEVSV